MISIRGMHKSYSSKYTGKQVVFSDFSLSLPESGFVSILGKSGCGKTTLLNILGGIDKIDSGSVVSFGYDISYFMNGNTLIDDYRKNIVGFVFQNYNLIHSISVYRNLALPLEMQGINKESIESKVKDVLKEVDMLEYVDRMPYELSGGQQQRVAIARAIIKDAKVILADEPTGNLDSETAKNILTLLKEISKTRLVVFVTHEEEYAYVYSNEIIKLKDGKIVNDYKLIEEESNDKPRSASSITWKAIFFRSLSHLKGSILKTTLIVLLFSVMIGVFASTITTITTSDTEILAKAINESDDFITNITSVGLVRTKSDELAFYSTTGRILDNYDAYLAYQNMIEKYGEENLVYNCRINIMNDFDLNNDYFTSNILPVTANLLNTDIAYDIPDLSGRLPVSNNEVVISDYMSQIIFHTEDSIGETLLINRYETYSNYVEKSLTIVGVVHTNYIEMGHDNKDKFLNDFLYTGSTNKIPDYGFVFVEHNPYSQIYVTIDMFDGLNTVHNVLDNAFGSLINFNLHVGDDVAFVYGDFYSDVIVESGSVIGRLPSTNTEIAINEEQLEWLFPDYTDEINNLKDGIISFDDFKTLMEIGDITISYDDESTALMYENVLPEAFTVVGVYQKRTDDYLYLRDNSVVITENLVQQLNENFPYNGLGLSIINSTGYAENIISDIGEPEFINVHEGPGPFDPTVIVSRMGVFNLYRSVESYNFTVVPLMKTILYVSLSFTFIMLFLYAFLNTQTNKKQIGIYRSLGFTCRDVIKMYVVEYGLISFVSLLVGLGIGLFGIDYINNLVFSKTIFLDSGLLQMTGVSTLYVLGISLGIVLLTSVLPMIKLLQMTPINIINKD